MKFCVLASGSSGNALWAEEGGRALVVDNGLSLADFRSRAELRGLAIGRISGILLTHEHTDHLSGVGSLSRAAKVPVYSSSKTIGAAMLRSDGGKLDSRDVVPGTPVTIGPFTVASVYGSHDSAEHLHFVLRAGGSSLGIATDLGKVPELLRKAFRGLDGALLEFNHDVDMLEAGSYPVHLKRRLKGPKGHLSNDEGAAFLAAINHPGLKCVVLGHISRNNNRPELVMEAARAAVAGGPGSPRLVVASHDRPTPLLTI
jgi:phosphoribosyl 1,2-cyclic phosphodiesterase